MIYINIIIYILIIESIDCIFLQSRDYLILYNFLSNPVSSCTHPKSISIPSQLIFKNITKFSKKKHTHTHTSSNHKIRIPLNT